MSAEQKSQLVDLNTIAYDAPLSFEPPPAAWIKAQTRKGNKWATLTVPDVDLHDKWIIITGANNGIGREAALRFASWGANLILACREPPPRETHPTVVMEECQQIAKEAGHVSAVEWWPLDMSSLASVEALAARWLKTGRALDLLCNNAGMGSSPAGSAAFITKDGFEIIHQVNFLSHVLLTLHLLPSLAKAPLPRVICTTSCFHYRGIFDLSNVNGEKPNSAGWDGVQFYMNNKLLFQIWLTELQRRLLQHDEYRHVTVQGVHPGYVNSGIWNLNGAASQQLLWKEALLKVVAWGFAITPQQGSLAILHAATSVECGPDPAVQGVGGPEGRGGGRYFNRVWEEEPMPHAKDADCRMRVWRKVDEELGLEGKGLLDGLGLRWIA